MALLGGGPALPTWRALDGDVVWAWNGLSCIPRFLNNLLSGVVLAWMVPSERPFCSLSLRRTGVPPVTVARISCRLSCGTWRGWTALVRLGVGGDVPPFAGDGGERLLITCCVSGMLCLLRRHSLLVCCCGGRTLVGLFAATHVYLPLSGGTCAAYPAGFGVLGMAARAAPRFDFSSAFAAVACVLALAWDDSGGRTPYTAGCRFRATRGGGRSARPQLASSLILPLW